MNHTFKEPQYFLNITPEEHEEGMKECNDPNRYECNEAKVNFFLFLFLGRKEMMTAVEPHSLMMNTCPQIRKKTTTSQRTSIMSSWEKHV
jgi:hypothetical protein